MEKSKSFSLAKAAFQGLKAGIIIYGLSQVPAEVQRVSAAEEEQQCFPFSEAANVVIRTITKPDGSVYMTLEQKSKPGEQGYVPMDGFYTREELKQKPTDGDIFIPKPYARINGYDVHITRRQIQEVDSWTTKYCRPQKGRN